MSDKDDENKKFKRIQKFGFPLGIAVFVAGVFIGLNIINDDGIPDELAGILGGLYVAVGVGTVFLTIAAKSNHDIMIKLIDIQTKLGISKQKNENQTKDLDVSLHDNSKNNNVVLSKNLSINYKTNIITLGLLVVIFSLVIWNVWSSYHESIKEYNFPSVEILKPITLTGYASDDSGTPILIYNESKPTYISSTFVSTSLSALNPITVKAQMEIRNINNTIWEGMPQVHILSYPRSYIYNDTGNFHEDAAIILTKNSDSHTYSGEQTIVFPFAGEYGFAIVDLDDASDKKITQDGSYTTVIAALTNLDEQVIEKSKIVIEPSISATNVKLAYLAQALVWILIGIGIMQLRTQIVNGVIWVGNQFK